MSSLRVERSIVEKDGKGVLKFSVVDVQPATEADLDDDQVRCYCGTDGPVPAAYDYHLRTLQHLSGVCCISRPWAF